MKSLLCFVSVSMRRYFFEHYYLRCYMVNCYLGARIFGISYLNWLFHSPLSFLFSRSNQ